MQPVVGAGQQEAQRRAPREQRQGLALRRRERAHALVAFEQGLALGDVEGVVRLEAPGIERDGNVVGEGIVAGEVEIDQGREPVAEEEDVVGKQVGVDDALLQSAGQWASRSSSSCSMVAASPGAISSARD